MGIVFVCLAIVGMICIVDANTIICWFKNNRALVHIIGASILTKEVNENKYYVCFGLEGGVEKWMHLLEHRRGAACGWNVLNQSI